MLWGLITRSIPAEWEFAGYDNGTVIRAFSSQPHYASDRSYHAVVKIDNGQGQVSVPSEAMLNDGDQVVLSTLWDKKNHKRRKYKYYSKGSKK